MRISFKKIITVFLLLGLFVLPLSAEAQLENQLCPGGQIEAGTCIPDAPNEAVQETDVGRLIFNILQAILSIIGLIAVVFVVYGGFKYMTANGDEEQIKAAKKTIVNAVIGLIVILLAWAIVSVVANFISDVPAGGSGGGVYPPGSSPPRR